MARMSLPSLRTWPRSGRRGFYGWQVVAAAFVLAVFGWGLGFYGPPVYLQTLRETRGWPVLLVSTALTVHFLVGASVIASLPRLYRRLGVPTVTKAGAISLALGISGWAAAQEPYQLFAACVLSGAGWVALGGAAVNAIVSPWFVRARPAALSMAYNRSSIGGVVFSPLWVAAIAAFGFPLAAALIGLVTIAAVWVLADASFARSPEQLDVTPDGDGSHARAVPMASPGAKPLPGVLLWRDFKFRTLAAAMAAGLFAQIGLIAHLFALLVPGLGAQASGFLMGCATAAAIGGRTVVGWAMPESTDRRLVACGSYAVQIAGSLALLAAAGTHVPLLILGVLLFGIGIGNATSLPPLIAQVEFTREDAARAVPFIIAIAQASYAFAPAAFGLVRQVTTDATQPVPGAAPWVFITAVAAQLLVIAALLAGGRGRRRRHLPI